MSRPVHTTIAQFLCVSIATFVLCSVCVGKAFGASDAITAKGVISAERVEVRCELPPPYASTTTVLEAIADGTEVKAGDLLIRLDPTVLENERSERQLAAIASKSQLIEAQSELEVSEVSLEAFIRGTYVEQKEAATAAVIVAEESLKLANRVLEFAREKFVANKGLAGEVAEKEFAVRKAQQDLRLAKVNLEVLEKYTKPKTLKLLEGAVASCRARLDLAQARHKSSEDRLRKLDEAIESCVLRSPIEGRVYYSAGPAQRDKILRPGSDVRARQVLLYVYDPRKTQFRATLSKSEAEQARAGLPATVRVDAYPQLSLKGQVGKVQATRGNGTIAVIDIADPPDSLRPGLTGQATIIVPGPHTGAPRETGYRR
jgi:HlyD family secretion protein